jgi:hypothetical protein
VPITGVLPLPVQPAIPMGSALRRLGGICAAGAVVIGLKLA